MVKLFAATSAVAAAAMLVGATPTTVRSLRGAVVPPSVPDPDDVVLAASLTASDFVPYPTYTGDLVVTGTVELGQEGSGANATQVISFALSGTDEFCGSADTTGIPNACGIHIHVGTSCSNASTVGDHFWNETAIEKDPWQTVMYSNVNQSADGSDLKVTTGLTNAEVADRVFVVHDAAGARIACSPMVMFVADTAAQAPNGTSTATEAPARNTTSITTEEPVLNTTSTTSEEPVLNTTSTTTEAEPHMSAARHPFAGTVFHFAAMLAVFLLQ